MEKEKDEGNVGNMVEKQLRCTQKWGGTVLGNYRGANSTAH